jgi:hypothetical protein
VNRPAKQFQSIPAKYCRDPGTSGGFPWNLWENALRCILLELSGITFVDLLWIKRLERNREQKIGHKYIEIEPNHTSNLREKDIARN